MTELDRIEFDGVDWFVVYDDERIAKRVGDKWRLLDAETHGIDGVVDAIDEETGEPCVEVRFKALLIRPDTPNEWGVVSEQIFFDARQH